MDAAEMPECPPDYSLARELFPHLDPTEPISQWSEEDRRTWCEWRREFVGADEGTCASGGNFYVGVDMCLATPPPDPRNPDYCDPPIGDVVECARADFDLCLGGGDSTYKHCVCSRWSCD